MFARSGLARVLFRGRRILSRMRISYSSFIPRRTRCREYPPGEKACPYTPTGFGIRLSAFCPRPNSSSATAILEGVAYQGRWSSFGSSGWCERFFCNARRPRRESGPRGQGLGGSFVQRYPHDL